MRKIIISGTFATEIIASIDTPIEELFNVAGVSIGGFTVMVDGAIIPPTNLNRTLRELGYNEEDEKTIVVQAVQAKNNAR